MNAAKNIYSIVSCAFLLASCAQLPPTEKSIIETKNGSEVQVELVRQTDPARGADRPYAYGTVLAPFKAPITKVKEVIVEAVELQSGCTVFLDTYTPVKPGLSFRGAFAAAMELKC